MQSGVFPEKQLAASASLHDCITTRTTFPSRLEYRLSSHLIPHKASRDPAIMRVGVGWVQEGDSLPPFLSSFVPTLVALSPSWPEPPALHLADNGMVGLDVTVQYTSEASASQKDHSDCKARFFLLFMWLTNLQDSAL